MISKSRVPEIWKDVLLYVGLYQVSNLGNVRSIRNPDKPKNLIQTKNRDGYMTVNLCKDKSKKRKSVHRIVAEAFIPNPDRKPTVNHIDGDKTNNCVYNLEWATRREQMRHASSMNVLGHKVEVICNETKQQFRSLRQAETALGLKKNDVRRSLNTGKPIHGYTFTKVRQYVNKQPKQLFNID